MVEPIGKQRVQQQNQKTRQPQMRNRRSSSLPDVREFHQPNWGKLHQVLSYDHSVEKVF